MSGLDLLIPQSALWYMLLVAGLAGALLGVFCDGLFILRLLCGDPAAHALFASKGGATTPPTEEKSSTRTRLLAILRGVCDFVAALLAFVIFLLLCYYTSDGQMRAPAIMGMIVGFWGYHRTVSRLVRRLLAFLIGMVGRFLFFVWSHTLGRLGGILIGAVIRRFRHAATGRRVEALTRDAARGFGLTDEHQP